MATPIPVEKRKSGGHIQSLERAFAILEETARHRDGLTLSDLSRSLDLHTSTLYHLVKTLVACGYLRQADNSKRYLVGRAVYALAASCYDETELCDIAAPYLEELSRETGESTHLAVWERDQILILARASGTSAFQINERTGLLRPTYCTAIGKALLSGLNDDEFRAHTAGLEFEPYTPNTLKGPAELLLQINRVKAEGIAFDDCEYNAETRCVAAPVRDFRGEVCSAIGFSAPIWRLSLTDTAELVPLTKRIARRLSEDLGYVTERDRKHG